MALSTTVLVNSITNLSDARYCAGMGVDMLGFGLDPKHPAYLEGSRFKEVAGWVAGVKLVGEFISTEVDEINLLSQAYNLDLVQLNRLYLLDELKSIHQPVIQKIFINKDTIETELMETLERYKPYVAYFLIDSIDFASLDDTNLPCLADFANRYPLILGFGIEAENIGQVLARVKPAGIALTGGNEIRPGYKDFDELQDIFELLETE